MNISDFDEFVNNKDQLATLKALPQWVVWKLEDRGGKFTKPPYQTDGRPASVTNPADWVSFESAVAAHRRGGFSGIGFVLTPDAGVVGIDLDHIRDPETGEILVPWAQQILDAVGSYVEVSPSKDGLHLLAMGALAKAGKFSGRQHAEIYNSGRYLTVTGCHIEGTPLDVVENQAGIDSVSQYIEARKVLQGFELSESCTDKILNGAPVGERSEAGASVIMSLIKAGATDEQIQSIFEQFPIGEKFIQKGSGRNRWLQGEIDRARGASGRKKQTPRSSGYRGKPELKTSDRMPLKREIPPSAPFPIDSLPGDLAELCQQVITVSQAPDAIIANSLLSTLSLVAQPFINVSIDGRVAPVSLNVTSVAVSGERKSTVDSLFLAPILRFEAEELAKWRNEIKAFESAKFIDDKKRAAVVKNARGDLGKLQTGLLELGNPPEPPPGRGIIAKDITGPGLLRMLMTGCPSMGLFMSEGGGFLGGYSMSKDNKLQTISHLSTLWDGGTIPLARAGDGFSYVANKRLTTHLMLQPVLVDSLFSDEIVCGQGFLSRMLTAWPESTIGDRLYRCEDINKYPAYQSYCAKAYDLIAHEKPLKDGTLNELDPFSMHLTREAKKSWVAFYNDIEKSMKKGGELEFLTGFGSKVPENALRIAAILEFWENQAEIEISIDSMDSAIELMRFYSGEMLRIVDTSSIERTVNEAERVLLWIQNQPGGIFSMADMIQKGPKFIRTRSRAAGIVQMLEEHSLIERTEPQEVGGKKRRDVWKVKAEGGAE